MALGSFRGNGIFSFALLATATLGGAATAHQAVDPAILALIRPGESLVGVGKPDLIERGRRLFTEETFGGNGRTCASCHPPDNNFTLDPAFIATLPRRDPLFVAEFDPRLRALENPAMLRRFALVLENLDGFGQPGVLRSVPHTLGLGQTIAPDTASGFPLAGATGWSGDGAPGNGSLRNFAVGAVVQHATKSLAREPGKDFRLPTEAELDMMLAFQLSLGRQAELTSPQTTDFQDGAVDAGRDLFFGAAPVRTRDEGTRTCSGCHGLAGANNGAGRNQQRAPGANRHPNAPACRGNAPGDGGFGPTPVTTVAAATVCGRGDHTITFRGGEFFSPPSLVEAADTPPFFHNNIADTVEQAVAFYASDAFNASPSGAGRGFVFGPGQVEKIAVYLRAINALENTRQAGVYLEQASGRPFGLAQPLLRRALVDAKDAIEVLTGGPLNPFAATGAVAALEQARDLIQQALGQDAAAIGPAQVALGKARGLMVE
jgi:mono/diheme cytochrome c family protein